MRQMETAISAIMDADYAYFGIRAIDDALAVGDTCRVSRIWDNGDLTDGCLDGTSATRINIDGYTPQSLHTALEVAAMANMPYAALHRYIIASDQMTYGEDVDEGVYRDAVVIAIIA